MFLRLDLGETLFGTHQDGEGEERTHKSSCVLAPLLKLEAFVIGF